MAIGDLYRIAFEYLSQSQTNVNVMYFKQTGSEPGNDAQAVAFWMAERLKLVYNPTIARPGRGQVVGVTATLVARIFGDVGKGTANWGVDGPNETPLPPANAVVVRLRTGLQGPTRRGRIFVGGVPGIWQTDGSLNAAGLAGYGAFISRMLADFGSPTAPGKMQLGVFSRERYSIISNPFDEYWKPVTQLAVAGPVSTMRSRKVGVGN